MLIYQLSIVAGHAHPPCLQWVLPPRPKPGRKSKKDLAAAAAKAAVVKADIEEDDEMDDEVEKVSLYSLISLLLADLVDRSDPVPPFPPGACSLSAISIEWSLNIQAVNRTKQKASRERKQEYIAELEAKVRTYEQGDGERASFFQVNMTSW